MRLKRRRVIPICFEVGVIVARQVLNTNRKLIIITVILYCAFQIRLNALKTS